MGCVACFRFETIIHISDVIPCATQHAVMRRRHGTSARTRRNAAFAANMEGLRGGAEVPALAALGRDDTEALE